MCREALDPRNETFPICQSPLRQFSKKNRLRKLDRCKVADPRFCSHKSPEEWQNQLVQRGWTLELIEEAIASGRRYPPANYVNRGNTATRCVSRCTRIPILKRWSTFGCWTKAPMSGGQSVRRPCPTERSGS